MNAIAHCGILSLPLEIREIIYHLCYLSPFPVCKAENDDPPPASKRRRLNKPVKAPRKASGHSLTRCKKPSAHLTLLSLNRQIRNEYFPIFAARHTFRITDPFIFANTYLCFTQPHRYSQIRHLKLFWKPQESRCQCRTEQRWCRIHTVESNNDFIRHTRKLIHLVNEYSELFNTLESLRFDIDSAYPETSSRCTYQTVALFENVILLLRELGQIASSEAEDKPERKYLVVPRATQRLQKNHMRYRVDFYSVSIHAWSLIPDGHILTGKACDACGLLWDSHAFPCRNLNVWRHDKFEWDNLDQLIDAAQDGTLSSLDQSSKASADTNWKVFIGQQTTLCRWRDAVEEVKSRERADELQKAQSKRPNTRLCTRLW